MNKFQLPASLQTPDQAMELLWSRRPFLAMSAVLFGFFGVIYALVAPTEYTTEARLMPEFQAGSAANLKRFGALADLVGIDLESVSTTEAVRPDLYPDVLSSTPFLLTVLNQPVTTSHKKTYPTLTAFLTTATRNPLMAWLVTPPLVMPKPEASGQSVRLSKEQDDLLKDVKKRIVSGLDPQSGLIDIRVKMPDEEVVAQVCQRAIIYLKQYVVTYRTDKTRTDLRFVEQRRHEAKVRYDHALTALSTHSDRNRFAFTQSARIDGKQLEAESNLAQTLYDELSLRYEQTRIKIQEETPILSVLEPPKILARRSEPHRTIIVLISAGFGLMMGAVWIFYKELN